MFVQTSGPSIRLSHLPGILFLENLLLLLSSSNVQTTSFQVPTSRTALEDVTLWAAHVVQRNGRQKKWHLKLDVTEDVHSCNSK